MIRIEKPAGPQILTGAENRGPKETQKLKDQFDSGETDFEFKSNIYGAKSVKNSLIEAQHEKCCFCESKFTHISYGDVEHFRPKGGWVQEEGTPLQKPGYYWLAYDWENLFASCQICNQRFKKNHFPLADPDKRANSHLDDLSEETPVLPHPADDDPEQFITYNVDGQPVAIDNNPRSLAMIQIFGLARQSIVDRRKEVLDGLLHLKEVYLLFKDKEAAGSLSAAEATHMESILQYFQEITSQESEYSVLKKAFLKDVL